VKKKQLAHSGRNGIRLLGLGLHNLADWFDEPPQLRLAI
jgi:hypothetical protein